MNFTESTKTANCQECGAQFTSAMASASILGRLVTFQEQSCQKCLTARERAIQSNSNSEENARNWSDVCPTYYQGFDMEKLPAGSRAVAHAVAKWDRSPKGIGLIGPSRAGKTFILMDLMGKLYEQGLSVHFPSSVDFAYAVGSPEQSERRRMIDKCNSVDILFIDDLGKEKMTERVESDLYKVFEERRRWMKPIFTTVNSDGAYIAGKMTSDRGEPTINRLKLDLCEFTNI